MLAAFLTFAALSAPLCAQSVSFRELLESSRGPAAVPPPAPAPADAEGDLEARQYLPPDNNEPGFDWPGRNKGSEDNFIYMGKDAAYFQLTAETDDRTLQNGSGKCALSPNTLYRVTAKPGFQGGYLTVTLAEPLPGCQFTSGFIYMMYVSSSSAGGAWELPKNIRAFLDTLAYAEGTDGVYNYIFTHAIFESYADHPRKRKCSGRLCSNAAGRYQFLSDTWDGLAPGLGLSDFTPPSQDKAVVELIRRAGAYKNVSKANVYENFTAALSKLNGTWASLPGSPYGQPTHSTAMLWKVYKAALAKY